MGINVIRAVKDGTLSDLISEFSASSVDDLFASVGYAKFTPKKILIKLQALIDPKNIEPQDTPTKPSTADNKDHTGGIVVKGIDDTLVHFAKCCKPVPGDQVVGFISRGRGVTPSFLRTRARRAVFHWGFPEQEHPKTEHNITTYNSISRTGCQVTHARRGPPPA